MSAFEDLIFSFLINGDSKQEIVYKMKLRGLDFSEKAYDEIFDYIKTQMLEFKRPSPILCKHPSS